MRWLPEVSKAPRTAWRNSPQTRRVAIGGAAIAAIASGIGVCTARAGLGALPGLEALRRALPDLQRRHPAGVVAMLVAAGDGLTRGTSTKWEVFVHAREVERQQRLTFVYAILYGKLMGRSVPSSFGPLSPGAPPLTGLVSLDGSPLPPYLDSDAAVHIAEEAGARAFRARTGASVRGLRLIRDPERGFSYVWGVTYFGSRSGAALGVAVDARTGELLSYNEIT